MTSSPTPRTRLFVDLPLSSGASVDLDRDRTHYLRNVLRLGPGDRIRLFNGRDGEWVAELSALGKAGAALTCTERLRGQEEGPDLWLLFAPIKGGRVDGVAEKATELGARVLRPVFTRRTDVSRVNADRLRANAVEAAEQSERLDVPELQEAQALVDVLADWDPDRTLFVCAEAGPAKPAAEAFAASGNRPAAILIGPEGGFDPAELDALRAHPAVKAISLGPRILRADTAAFAALALWQAVCGDGARRPPGRS